MIDTLLESLPVSIAVFVAAAVVITVLGVRLSLVADRLADVTGWGEAMVGGLLLAAATSLPDFTATVTAAADGRPELAMSNVLGSMAVNLAFLGVGDIIYRKANLEHAAASSANLIQAALLVTLLTVPLIAMAGPAIHLWGLHPATPALLLGYVMGYYAVRGAHVRPMWSPRRTSLTVEDKPDPSNSRGRSAAAVATEFAFLALGTAVAGWVLMTAAETIADATPLSDTAVGALFTGVITSMPELVTTIAAVRHGALTLAVGNILGTNCFNVTVIAAADIAYREGSIYHAVTAQQPMWGLVTILMTGILLVGLVYRERYGIGRIGLESLMMLVIYGGVAISVVTL